MNPFFKIFLLVVLSVFSTLNLSALRPTFGGNDTFFSSENFRNEKTAIDADSIDAWEIIRRNIDNFGTTTTKFALDEAVLNKVSDLMQEGSVFRTKMTQIGEDWESVLSDILKTNKNLKCTNCGNLGIAYRSKMDVFLDEAEYFISNFDITNNVKGKKYFNMLQGKTLNGVPYSSVNLPVFDELHQALRYLKNNTFSVSDIQGFGLQIGNTGKYGDIIKSNGTLKYIELKSLKQGQGLDDGLDVLSGLNATPLKSRTQFVNQFIDGYLSTINSLDELNYVFEIRKLGANGETFVKNQFKDLFIAKSEDVFQTIWNNQNLRTNLFGNRTQTAAQTYFNTLKSNTNSTLYNFIKVE